MIPARSTPPSFPERILSAILGTDPWTESIVGDLHEEYARLAAASRRLARPRADVLVLPAGPRARCTLRGRSRVRETVTRRPDAPRHPANPRRFRHAYIGTRNTIRAAIALEAPGAQRAGDPHAGVGPGRERGRLREHRRPDSPALHDSRRRSRRDGRRDVAAGQRYGGARETVSPANFLDWKRQTDVFERLAAFEWWDVNLAGVDDPERDLGLPRLGRLLSRAARGARARADVRGRRRDARTAPARDHRAQPLATPFPGRPRRHRENDSARYRAVRSHRCRAGGVRLSDGRGNLGAAVVRRGGGRPASAAIPLRRRAARARAIGRGCPGTDGGDRRAPRAAVSGSQSRTGRAGVDAHRGHARPGAGTDPGALAGLGRVRAAHRVREHREPAARARRPSGSETWRCAWPSARAAAG